MQWNLGEPRHPWELVAINAVETQDKVKKFETVLYPQKVLTSAFWDRKGILLLKFLLCGGTVNADQYCDYFEKNWGMRYSRSVIILQGNATLHTANKTKELLQSFGWDVLNHPVHLLEQVTSIYS